MSGQATGWVLRHGPGATDRSAHAVLITIADAANRDGEQAHPGIEGMIAGSAYTRSVVFAALGRLKAGGWIEETEPGGGRRVPDKKGRSGKFAVYCIPGVLDPDWQAKGPASGPLESAKGPAGESQGSGCAEPTVRPVEVRAMPLRDGLETHGLETHEGSTIVDPRTDPAYRFDEFWDHYPKRNDIRRRKVEALAAWKKLKYPEKATAYRNLVHFYAPACTAGDEIAADAATWLRNRRWEAWDHPAVPDVRPDLRRRKPTALDSWETAARRSPELAAELAAKTRPTPSPPDRPHHQIGA